MLEDQAVPDPLALLRRFRRTYTNYYALWTSTGEVPEGVTLRRPSEHPLTEDQLPAALRAVLDQYRKAHPNLDVTLLKYMRTVNGRPELVVEDEEDLPPDEALLTLSQTTTANAHDTLQVVTDLVVARTR
jgi:hypothetical protein